MNEIKKRIRLMTDRLEDYDDRRGTYLALLPVEIYAIIRKYNEYDIYDIYNDIECIRCLIKDKLTESFVYITIKDANINNDSQIYFKSELYAKQLLYKYKTFFDGFKLSEIKPLNITLSRNDIYEILDFGHDFTSWAIYSKFNKYRNKIESAKD